MNVSFDPPGIITAAQQQSIVADAKEPIATAAFEPENMAVSILAAALGVDIRNPIGREIIQGTRYETGTYTQRNNATSATVYFKENHDEPPIFWFSFDDRRNPTYQVDTYYGFIYIDYEKLLGFPLQIQRENSATHSNRVVQYGELTYYTTGSNSQYLYYITKGAVNLSENTTSVSPSAYERRYYTSSTYFRMRTYQATKYLRNGQRFNWLAIWKPE